MRLLFSHDSVASAAAAAAAAGAANANGGDADDVTRANRGERDRELMQRLGMCAVIRWVFNVILRWRWPTGLIFLCIYNHIRLESRFTSDHRVTNVVSRVLPFHNHNRLEFHYLHSHSHSS